MIKARYSGQPRGSGTAGGTASGKSRNRKAAERDMSLAPAIAESRSGGCLSAGEIADHFNQRGIRAPLGGLWSSSQIRRLIKQLEASSMTAALNVTAPRPPDRALIA
jgi:hypothetical protein